MHEPSARTSWLRFAWDDVRAQALVNHGLVLTADAVRAGLSASTLSRAVRRGELVRLAPRVLGVRSLLDDRSHLAAVCMSAPAAVASHRAAARLLGLDGIDVDVVEVSVPGTGRPRRPHVHRSDDLVASDITVVDGIRTTDAARTLCDLGSVCPVDVVERALESALRLGLVTVETARGRCADLGGRGRAGPPVLRQVLEGRWTETPPTESELESLAVQCLRAAGVPEPVRQHVVRHAGRFVARVDLAWPAARLYVELDGRAHHGSWAAQRRDLDRQNRLTAAGWSPLRYTWREVVHGGADVGARTLQALRGRLAA